MRLLGRLGFGALLVAVLYGLLPDHLPGIGQWKNQRYQWESNHLSYQVFWLQEQPLLFDLPAHGRQLRVGITPVLLDGAAPEAMPEIDYQLFNAQGGQLKTFRHALLPLLQEDIASAVEAEPEPAAATVNSLQQQKLPPRFFDRPDGQLAGATRYFYIDVDQRDPFTLLRIALSGPGQQRVAVRVSSLEQRQEPTLPVIWQRMTSEERQSTLDDHIYPPALVDVGQRNTALRYDWRPMGPRGAINEDYVESMLFSHRDISEYERNTEQPETDSLPRGSAGPDQYVTFFRSAAIPVDALSCIALDGQPLAWMQVRYQRDFSRRLEALDITGAALASPWALPRVEGLFEVSASAPCRVQLWADGAEVADQGNLLRGYRSAPGELLRFRLVADSDNYQPLRLDLRALFTAPASDSDQRMRWRLLDSDGALLREGVVALTAAADSYQRLQSELPGERLAARQSLFLLASPQAAQLEVESLSGAALVNLYSRPLLLPQRSRPQLGRSTLAADESLPLWYLVKPEGSQQLMQAGRDASLVWYHRPLLEEPETRFDVSEWQDLQAVDGRGRHALFAPLAVTGDDSDPLRPDLTFVPLRADQRQLLISGSLSERSVAPQLVYRRAVTAPQEMALAVDSQPRSQHWLVGSAGRLTLPDMSLGLHELMLDAPADVDWFINHAAPAGGEGYRIYSVYPLAGEVQFNIAKQVEQEWLTLRYFPTAQRAHLIRLRLLGAERQSGGNDFTVIEREYEIAAGSAGDQGTLLNQGGSGSGAAITLRFKLGGDLPAGSYRLAVSSDQGNSGYVQAGIKMDEVSSEVRIFYEDDSAL